jgi:hypothetical protein
MCIEIVGEGMDDGEKDKLVESLNESRKCIMVSISFASTWVDTCHLLNSLLNPNGDLFSLSKDLGQKTCSCLFSFVRNILLIFHTFKPHGLAPFLYP